MKSPKEYVESIRKMNMNIYMFGEKIENPVDHPMIRPSLNAVMATYTFAEKPEYADLMTAKSHLTGKTINRFTNIHQTNDDLIKKVKMLRLLGQETASCFQRCVGMDAFNAMYSTTYDIDKKLGTPYHERFKKYLTQAQEEDWTIDGAMTDPKGDRSLSPSAQADPDLFLHIVKETPEGIVVRGAKVHQTGIANSHEVLVMPTLAMKEADKDYAVSFAVPVDTKGIVLIYGRQSCDMRKLEQGMMDRGNPKYGGHEALVVFDDVFVPTDRIFMLREYEFSGLLVERFAGFHRQSYGGCKVGVGDVLIGATALIADYNGTNKASHIKDKLIEMVHLNETLYAGGIACSCEGHQTPAGTAEVDMMLANVCKQNVTRFPYEIARISQDIAGGAMVTLPSEQDFRSSAVGHYVEKYFKGVASVPVEDRMKIFRLIENITLGTAAVGYLTESMHGAGSPQAQRVVIGRLANLEAKKELAKTLVNIKS